jgi:transporter family-2 protein
VANTVTFIIPGQVLPSIILDHFGLLNLPGHPVSLARIGGAALVKAGILVVPST